MAIVVRFMSLTGKLTCVREESFDNYTDAFAAVRKHAEQAGYTKVKTVESKEPDMRDEWRYTATTPGGRAGRNVAFGEDHGHPQFPELVQS